MAILVEFAANLSSESRNDVRACGHVRTVHADERDNHVTDLTDILT